MIYFIMTDDPSDRDFLLEIYREFEKLMFYTASKYGQYILGKPANGIGDRAIYQPTP